jgi:S1-C subfamily serine protease
MITPRTEPRGTEEHAPIHPIPPPRRSTKRAATHVTVMATVILGLALIILGLTWFATAGSTDTAAGTDTTETLSATTPGTTPAVAGLTDVSDIATDVVDSVVTVEVMGRFRGREEVVGSGSGVIIDSDGTIITNAHVVEGATGLNVVLGDGTTHTATVLGIDTTHDVAVIDIETNDLAPIALGSTNGLLVGHPVIAVGSPLGLEGGPSVSTGIVSALDRTLSDADVTLSGIIQTDAAITEGSSGGALLDSQGHLIGITTAVGVSRVGIEGIGFAIPVETITEVVSELTGG